MNYLKKTHSHLVIPTIVKEEMIANYTRHLRELVSQINNKSAELDRWCLGNGSKTKININIADEASRYQTFLEELKQNNLSIDLPYQDHFLNEVIQRLIHRKKPASDKGEEFRDVLIWISIKDYLQEIGKEAIFISGDNHFSLRDSVELHKDLYNELHNEGLNLKFFKSVEQFIEEQSSKVDFITEDWIKQVITLELYEDKFAEEIENSEGMWQRYFDRKDIDWTGYIAVVGFWDLELESFYVYELETDDFYLHVSFYVSIEFESEYMETHAPSGTADIRIDNTEIGLDIEARIHNKEIQELKLEDWDFL